MNVDMHVHVQYHVRVVHVLHVVHLQYIATKWKLQKTTLVM